MAFPLNPLSQAAFLMCSFAQEETESSKYWDSLRDVQPSGAVWASVESRPVFMFTAETEGHVWTLAHLCSKCVCVCGGGNLDSFSHYLQHNDSTNVLLSSASTQQLNVVLSQMCCD